MTRWRLLVGLALLAVLASPLLFALDELRRLPASWLAWAELDRIGGLLLTSTLLTAASATLTLLLGLPLAALLFRSDLPGRRWWQALVVLSLFVPLPLILTAFQMSFGRLLASTAGTPWSTGLLPAILVHSLLGLPWSVIVIGLGLLWVEPELEEDALAVFTPWQVFWRVSVVRAAPAILLAGLIVALQCWSEMAVTDFVQVRSFAEEVYIQFQGGGTDERARATAIAVPFILLVIAGTLMVLGPFQRRLPAAATLVRPARLYPLGAWRWPAFGVVSALALLLLGPMLLGLVLKAGLHYATRENPGEPTWEAGLLVARFIRAVVQQREMLLTSLGLALAVGVIAALAASLTCWLARGSPWFAAFAWVLAAALWATPGPVLGIGWLDMVQHLMSLPGGSVVRLWLYERPSPLPNLWICTARFFPIALAVLWPLVRVLPHELEDSAELDGLGPWRRFVLVILPVLRRPLCWTVLVVAVMALGEISASKIVATPGFTPLAHHLFQQMHASADTELAALALVLLGVILLGALAVMAFLPSRWPSSL
jgi:iron(III) transport system permease protein